MDCEDQPCWTTQAETLEQRQAKRGQARVGEEIRTRNVIFVAEEDSEIVDFCWCSVADRGIDKQGEIAELYVEKEHGGKGIGAKLVEAAEQRFIKEKLNVAFAFTHYGYEDAIRLYEKAGFARIKQLVLYFVPPNQRHNAHLTLEHDT